MKKITRLIGIGGKSLASLLEGFKTKLAELDALIADHTERHKANAETIRDLIDANGNIDAEVRKAVKVRQNIAQLIEEN